MAADTIAKGNALQKSIRRISTKNEEIKSCTKTPEMPTRPKLIALLGNNQKVRL